MPFYSTLFLIENKNVIWNSGAAVSVISEQYYLQLFNIKLNGIDLILSSYTN